MKLFCWFGLHAWISHTKWEPSIDAPIVTKATLHLNCSVCGKHKEEVIYDIGEDSLKA
jgi:ribosomal protein L44E